MESAVSLSIFKTMNTYSQNNRTEKSYAGIAALC